MLNMCGLVIGGDKATYKYIEVKVFQGCTLPFPNIIGLDEQCRYFVGWVLFWLYA